MSMWTMYWLVKLDNIQTMFEILSIAGGVVLIVTAFVAVICIAQVASTSPEYCKVEKGILEYIQRHVKKIVALPVFFLCMAVFIPTTKQMAAIIIVPKLASSLAENEGLKELPNNLVELANDWIETLKPQQETADVR